AIRHVLGEDIAGQRIAAGIFSRSSPTARPRSRHRSTHAGRHHGGTAGVLHDRVVDRVAGAFLEGGSERSDSAAAFAERWAIARPVGQYASIFQGLVIIPIL